MNGDARYGEAAPVHVYGLGGAALEKGGAKSEEVLAVLAAAGDV